MIMQISILVQQKPQPVFHSVIWNILNKQQDYKRLGNICCAIFETVGKRNLSTYHLLIPFCCLYTDLLSRGSASRNRIKEPNLKWDCFFRRFKMHTSEIHNSIVNMVLGWCGCHGTGAWWATRLALEHSEFCKSWILLKKLANSSTVPRGFLQQGKTSFKIFHRFGGETTHVAP